MAGPLLLDRVHETSITTGTGAFSLSGAITGHRTFASALSVGDTFPYCIAAQGGTEWEVGIGTLSTSTTLTRTTVLASSNSGSAVNFSAGSKDCFLTYPAGRGVLKTGVLTAARVPYVSANGELTDSANLAFDGTALKATSSSPSLNLNTRSAFISNSVLTNTSTPVVVIGHNTTGTPAANFGAQIDFWLESSTTEDSIAGSVVVTWSTATHASRAGDITLYAHYAAAAQEGIRIRAASGGVQIGVFGATPVTRTAAFTQTYSTATRTHSNLTAGTITDGTGGTADGSLQDYSAAYNQTRCNNNAADLAAAINAVIVDVANVKQVLNQVIDDLQAYGWLQ